MCPRTASQGVCGERDRRVHGLMMSLSKALKALGEGGSICRVSRPSLEDAAPHCHKPSLSREMIRRTEGDFKDRKQLTLKES